MEFIQPFSDKRHLAFCIHCGGHPDTLDHAPSKILLDKPYPPHLPQVGACRACNVGFSADEAYVACLVECVLNGSTKPEDLRREKVKQLLLRRPSMRGLMEDAFGSDLFGPVFRPNLERVQRVVLKLARCHAAYENSEPQLDSPSSITILPFSALSPTQLAAFEKPPPSSIWPEIGSRAFQRLLEPVATVPWLNVQEGRYRYLVTVTGGLVVRMVLSEYLACEVVWT